MFFPIAAAELLKLRGIEDYTLFDKNVRYALGNTRVIKAIRKTLTNESEKANFLLYHNGISLVCEKFNYYEDDNKLEINNYSIVNGAQSTLTFHKHQSLLNEKVKILLKVIEVGADVNLTNAISIYNNNQNAITMKDLRSNDLVQRRLEREFIDIYKNHNLNIEYVPKKGKLTRKDCIEIASDYAAQLITSCYLLNPYNIHLKTSMFDSSYNTIFNRNINASKIIMYYFAHKALKDNLNFIDDERIATYGLAQHFILSILFKVLYKHSKTAIILDDANYYLDKIENYNTVFCLLINIISGVFNHYMDEYKTGDFDYKNFFKSKDRVEELARNIITMFDASFKIMKRTYEDIVAEAGI